MPVLEIPAWSGFSVWEVRDLVAYEPERSEWAVSQQCWLMASASNFQGRATSAVKLVGNDIVVVYYWTVLR